MSIAQCLAIPPLLSGSAILPLLGFSSTLRHTTQQQDRDAALARGTKVSTSIGLSK